MPHTHELTGLIPDADWNKIRDRFSEAEKVVLRQAVTGQILCPKKGVVIDPDKLPRPLYQKLKAAMLSEPGTLESSPPRSLPGPGLE